jgi:RNA polymerase sigma-70 factor (ECF subfamily)
MSKISDRASASGRDEDSELVLRSKQGDIEAFEQLVLRHQKKMVNIAYRMIGSYEDACDVVQDALVLAYKEIGRFEGRSQFTTWLCTIVINLSRNRLKQIKSAWNRNEMPIHAEDGAVSVDPPSGTMSALEQLEKRDIERSVQECIEGLEEEFKTAVVLRDIQGYTYNEISNVLKVAEGTVKSRIFRAREMLKTCLKEKLGEL